MILPDPMVICPTSELPICPSGNPTAFDEAAKDVYGSENSFLKIGESAWMMPLCVGFFVFIQNPSRIIRASFFIAILEVIKLLSKKV